MAAVARQKCIEIVKGDIDDETTLRQAFAGAVQRAERREAGSSGKRRIVSAGIPQLRQQWRIDETGAL